MTAANGLHLVMTLLVTMGSPAVGFAQESSDGGSISCSTASDVNAEDDCYKDILQKCKDEGKSAVAMACKPKSGAGINEKTAATSADYGASAELFRTAVQKCEDQKKKCTDLCGEKQTKKKGLVNKCTDGLAAVQKDFMNSNVSFSSASAGYGRVADSTTGGDPKTQTTNPTTTTGGDKTATKEEKGGGMKASDMIGMAAVAGVAGMAIMKATSSDDEPAAVSNSAIQGQNLLCDKADSGIYVACNKYLEDACTQSIQNGTFSSSPTCTNFATRYCTGGDGTVDPLTPSTTVLGVEATTVPTMGVQGGGSSTKFCSSAIAYNYCAGGAYPTCNKCLELQQLTSLACQSNPASCMAQSSDAAANSPGSACPGYPTTNGSAAPAVIATGIPAATTGDNSVLGAIALPGASPVVQPASLQGASTNSIIGRSTASAVGPRSDIGGEYGPSLSNLTSQAISKRCQVDHLNNCP